MGVSTHRARTCAMHDVIQLASLKIPVMRLWTKTLKYSHGCRLHERHFIYYHNIKINTERSPSCVVVLLRSGLKIVVFCGEGSKWLDGWAHDFLIRVVGRASRNLRFSAGSDGKGRPSFVLFPCLPHINKLMPSFISILLSSTHNFICHHCPRYLMKHCPPLRILKVYPSGGTVSFIVCACFEIRPLLRPKCLYSAWWW